jgi:hypothetical protein
MIRRNTPDGDWTFGQSLADYTAGDELIKQNVITRIKSFQNDWFLDMDAHIDWFDLLGRKNTQEAIKREVERVCLETEGVVAVTRLILTKNNRQATIELDITTVFNTALNIQLGIE